MHQQDTDLKGNSPHVVTHQSAPHSRLLEHFRRRLDQPWRAHIDYPSREAFEQLIELLRGDENSPLILDSGCGTGMSTARLAHRFKDHLVIGIDRSSARLRRSGLEGWPCRQGNCIFVRAELSSFWRLAKAAGWQLARHYLLYPNPWPKARHLGKRWHTHPVFPDFLALGGWVEMRCNWNVYAQEFAQVTGWLLGETPQVERMKTPDPMTRFEAKYAASGHDLYRVRFDAKKGPGNPGPSKATKVHSS